MRIVTIVTQRHVELADHDQDLDKILAFAEANGAMATMAGKLTPCLQEGPQGTIVYLVDPTSLRKWMAERHQRLMSQGRIELAA